MSDKDLYKPVCAGAAHGYQICPRCGARSDEPCGDELARSAQLAEYPPAEIEEEYDVF